ncbi:MAG: hypothetical protein ABR585_13930, partial [Gemmatimonadaceae bacterium]
LPPHLVLRFNQLLEAQASETRNELYELRRKIGEVDLDALKREGKLLEFMIGTFYAGVIVASLAFSFLLAH